MGFYFGTKTITVQSPAGVLSVTPSDGLTSSGNQGGPFTPSNKPFILQNTGGSSINWTASKGQAWVSLSSTSGTLGAGANTTVTVSINSNANSLTSGTYSDTVSFTNTTNGNGNTTRPVSLTVTYQTETVSTPNTPSGPTSGAVGTSYTYSTGGATSSLGHSVEYRFNWGDGKYSNWSSSATDLKSWSYSGTYGVKAQARCAIHIDKMSNESQELLVGIQTIATTHTLTVASSNPNSGVSITVSPNDNNGQGSGITQFTRTYGNNTVVTLTAPSTAGGNSFQKWQRNGVDYSTSQSTTATMDTNYTMVAVYMTSSAQTGSIRVSIVPQEAVNAGAQWKLTTESTWHDNGNIVDNLSFGTYQVEFKPITGWIAPSNKEVTIFAGQPDIGINSDPYTRTPVTTRTLTIASSNPNNGVSITVSPNDKNGQGNGTTPFTRVYDNNTTVTLTAPLTTGDNNFQKWQRDGSDAGFKTEITVTLDADYTMTAVYVGCVYSLSSTSQSFSSNGGSDKVDVTASSSSCSWTATSTADWITIISGSSGTGNGTVSYSVSAYTDTSTRKGTMTIAGQTFTITQYGGPTPTPLNSFIIQHGHEGKDTCYGTVYATDGTPDAERLYMGGWVDWYYDFFEFDLTNSPSADITVSATFYVHGSAPYDGSDPAFQIYRITESWTESGVTSSNNPAATYYKDFGSFAVSKTNTWNSVDITDLYKNWKNGAYPNYGIKLVPTNNNHSNGDIASSDNSDSSIRPKIEIVYTSVSTTPTPTVTPTPTPTRIIRLEGDLSFGEVQLGGSVQRTMTIYNDGNSPLTVDSISYPSGFSGNWGSGVIAAGSSQQVAVSFAPTEAKVYREKVTVNSNATSGTNTMPVSGAGTTLPTRIIRLEGDLSFGDAPVGGSVQQAMTISNDGNSPLTVNSISYPAGFSGNWGSGVIAAGSTQQVAVSFAPTEVKVYSGNVTVNCDKTSGTNTRPVSGMGMTTPIYTLTVASSNPNSGVSITVSPNDNDGLGNGTTQFARTYNNNTSVTLTAPSAAGGNSFQKWQRNGVDLTTSQTANVAMDANYTMMAVYATFPSPTPTPTPGMTGNIAGQVTDSMSGAGINGATVTLNTGESTTSGSVQGQDGVYSITGISVGQHEITASASNYATSSQIVTVVEGYPNPQTGKNVFNFALTPTPTCNTANLDAEPEPLKLKREGSANETVTVTCENGEPKAGIMVTAIVRNGKKRVSVVPSSAVTDTNGQSTFTITARKKTGNAKVRFETTDGLRDNVSVKVSK